MTVAALGVGPVVKVARAHAAFRLIESLRALPAVNETRYCTVAGILYALPASETTLHCALWVQGHSAAQCARGHRAQPPRSPQSPLPRAIVAGIAEPAFDPPVPEAYGSLCPARSPCGAGICIPLSLRRMAVCALLAAPVGPASDPPVPEAYGSLCPARSPRGAGICIALSVRRMAACALLAALVGPASVSPCLHSPLYMGAHLPAGFARKALTARSNSRQYWSRPTCTETPRAM